MEIITTQGWKYFLASEYEFIAEMCRECQQRRRFVKQARDWQNSLLVCRSDIPKQIDPAPMGLVEPRLTSATWWYITADPSEIDCLEFAYLAGGEGPQVESKSGWAVDGVKIRIILDFGAGFIDHRGWFANASA